MVLAGVTGRWSRRVGDAGVRADRRRVVSRSTGGPLGRSSGACGCGTPRSRLANRLRLEHPDEPLLWLYHATSYQALYLQGRVGLRADDLCAAHRSRMLPPQDPTPAGAPVGNS